MHAPDNAHISIGSGSPDHEINLSEKKLRLYWDRIRDLPEKEKGGIEVIQYHPDIPPDVLAWLKQNLERLRRVFESARDGLPLRVKGEPVKINIKPDARPKRCPQPKWEYGAKFNIISKWARKGLDCGMFGFAPKSAWASRPHIALKGLRGSLRDSDVFDIQIVGNYVQVNSQIQKLKPNGPDAMAQIRRAAGHHRYWYTDGNQQY
jgi:hypothetical protein